jgi:hypothetical protein
VKFSKFEHSKNVPWAKLHSGGLGVNPIKIVKMELWGKGSPRPINRRGREGTRKRG